jgi:hypothetical protein
MNDFAKQYVPLGVVVALLMGLGSIGVEVFKWATTNEVTQVQVEARLTSLEHHLQELMDAHRRVPHHAE